MRLAKVLSICALIALMPALAAAQNAEVEAEPITMLGHEAEVYFFFPAPHFVQSYAVVCHNAETVPTLQFGVKDCCIAGDHWEAKAHFFDAKPVDAAVCGGGGTTLFRTVSASSLANPLRSIVNVRYAHGVNIFSAGGYMRFTCYPTTATIEVTDLGQVPDLR